MSLIDQRAERKKEIRTIILNIGSVCDAFHAQQIYVADVAGFPALSVGDGVPDTEMYEVLSDMVERGEIFGPDPVNAKQMQQITCHMDMVYRLVTTPADVQVYHPDVEISRNAGLVVVADGIHWFGKDLADTVFEKAAQEMLSWASDNTTVSMIYIFVPRPLVLDTKWDLLRWHYEELYPSIRFRQGHDLGFEETLKMFEPLKIQR